MAIPTFQDWQQNMTFAGLSGAEQAKARSSQKYYNNFARAAQGKYGNAVIAEHGLSGGGGGTDPFAAMFSAMAAGPSGSSASELQAQAQADADAREAERLKTIGLNDRDALFNDYTGAAETATSYINNLVAKERSNALLMGVDYVLTEEDKLARTENYFADIWSSADQENLQGLYDEWGYMDGMDESTAWALKRGVPTGDTDEATADAATVTPIQGQGSTLSTEGLLVDDETTQTSLLGA